MASAHTVTYQDRYRHKTGGQGANERNNGEPAVLVNHDIVRRWRCGSLVTQRPLSFNCL